MTGHKRDTGVERLQSTLVMRTAFILAGVLFLATLVAGPLLLLFAFATLVFGIARYRALHPEKFEALKAKHESRREAIRAGLFPSGSFEATRKWLHPGQRAGDPTFVDHLRAREPVAIDTVRGAICFSTRNPRRAGEREFSYTHHVYHGDQILEVHVVEDGFTLTKTSTTSTVGRAILGNLLAGSAGLVVGGATAERISSGFVTSIELKVLVNDLDRPLHVVQFLAGRVKRGTARYRAALQIAEEWRAMLEVAMHRVQEGETRLPVPQGPNRVVAVGSIADEINKLDALRARGILTDGEFEEQKSRLLAMKP